MDDETKEKIYYLGRKEDGNNREKIYRSLLDEEGE